MVALGFLGQNTAIGIVFGSFGTMVVALQHELGTSRALISAGPAIMMLMLGLVAPVVGSWIGRHSIRLTMMTGAALLSVGFLGLAIVTDIRLFIALFALTIGPGAAMLGVVPAATLVSRWFSARRGVALGVTHLPVFLLITPPLAAWLIRYHGPSAVFLAAGTFSILLIPILLLVVDRPPNAAREESGDPAPLAAPTPAMATFTLLGDWRFWTLNVASGLLAAGGSTYSTQIVAMVTGLGIPLSEGAVMLSAFGLASVVGAMFFGWLADRVGAPGAYAVAAMVLAASWTVLRSTADYGVLVGVALLSGLCLGAIGTLHAAASGTLFGHENVGKVMGFGYTIKVPFIFAAPVFAGYVFDVTGSYKIAILVHVLGFGVAGSALLLLASRRNSLRVNSSSTHGTT